MARRRARRRNGRRRVGTEAVVYAELGEMERLLEIDVGVNGVVTPRGLGAGKPHFLGAEMDVVVLGFEGPVAPEGELAPDAEHIAEAIFAAVRIHGLGDRRAADGGECALKSCFSCAQAAPPFT